MVHGRSEATDTEAGWAAGYCEQTFSQLIPTWEASYGAMRFSTLSRSLIRRSARRTTSEAVVGSP